MSTGRALQKAGDLLGQPFAAKAGDPVYRQAERIGRAQIDIREFAVQPQLTDVRVLAAQAVEEDLAFGILTVDVGKLHAEIDRPVAAGLVAGAQGNQVGCPQRQSTEAVDGRAQARALGLRHGRIVVAVTGGGAVLLH